MVDDIIYYFTEHWKFILGGIGLAIVGAFLISGLGGASGKPLTPRGEPTASVPVAEAPPADTSPWVAKGQGAEPAAVEPQQATELPDNELVARWDIPLFDSPSDNAAQVDTCKKGEHGVSDGHFGNTAYVRLACGGREYWWAHTDNIARPGLLGKDFK